MRAEIRSAESVFIRGAVRRSLLKGPPRSRTSTDPSQSSHSSHLPEPPRARRLNAPARRAPHSRHPLLRNTGLPASGTAPQVTSRGRGKKQITMKTTNVMKALPSWRSWPSWLSVLAVAVPVVMPITRAFLRRRTPEPPGTPLQSESGRWEDGKTGKTSWPFMILNSPRKASLAR